MRACRSSASARSRDQRTPAQRSIAACCWPGVRPKNSSTLTPAWEARTCIVSPGLSGSPAADGVPLRLPAWSGVPGSLGVRPVAVPLEGFVERNEISSPSTALTYLFAESSSSSRKSYSGSTWSLSVCLDGFDFRCLSVNDRACHLPLGVLSPFQGCSSSASMTATSSVAYAYLAVGHQALASPPC